MIESYVSLNSVEKVRKFSSIAKRLVKEGSLDEATEVLKKVTDTCTELLYDLAKREADRIAEIVKSSGGLYGRQKEAIEKYIEYSEIDLF